MQPKKNPSNEELLEKLKRIKHPNNPPVHHQKHPTKEINPVLWILIILGAIVLLAGLIYLITFVINLPKPENKDAGGYEVIYGNSDAGEIPSGFDVGGSSSSSNTSPGSSSSGTTPERDSTSQSSQSSGSVLDQIEEAINSALS